MKGQILAYDSLKGEGVISSEDGGRYAFNGDDWRGDAATLQGGAMVDFTVDGDRASEVYLVPATTGATPASPGAGPAGGASQPSYAAGQYPKSPIAAGLLALFLGGLGVHKFYLGYNAEGGILLAATIVSWVLMFVIIGVFGLMAVGVIVLIEAIMYLTKNPEEFHQTYVVGRKPWF